LKKAIEELELKHRPHAVEAAASVEKQNAMLLFHTCLEKELLWKSIGAFSTATHSVCDESNY
jgi:hypothetical protein